IGAEEQYPNFGNASVLARLLGLPMFPLLPQALIGLALPLPTRYRIYFGEPLHFEGDPDDDDAEIEAHVQLVRDTVQNMVVRGLGERKHIFW
ncbi:MAG TPA: glycerol acyltransferase, partial [Polyangiales bacterium]|nr:glycerol acyltransferase [Polyangiales bacterium]